MFKQFINGSEQMVKKMTSFCIELPGFKGLSADDRIALVKSKPSYHFCLAGI